MGAVVLFLLLAFVAIASATLWPALYAAAIRERFRTWPEARDAFVGSGSWISFSRRFGRAYALGAFALAFAWIFAGAHSVPDTTVGAWLLFGPAILLIAVSVVLAALAVCRWVVDE
jgi:hypothetical protein